MNVSEVLDAIRSSDDYAGQIAHVRTLPGREPRHGTLEHEPSEKMQVVLRELGIDRLYTHQTEAINLALAGEDVVVVAATASGKTLCYTIPIAEAIYERGTSRAFLIFPTKALAQDQLRKLE
ncbi:MAG: DEAD/DEAH box helicase, partial [Armatimonadota bacterium]